MGLIYRLNIYTINERYGIYVLDKVKFLDVFDNLHPIDLKPCSSTNKCVLVQYGYLEKSGRYVQISDQSVYLCGNN